MSRKLDVRVGANITEYQRKMQQVQREFSSLGNQLSSISNTIRNNVTLPFVAAATAGTMLSAGLETELVKINTLVGISGSQFDELRSSIKGISDVTGIAQQAMAAAAFTIVSAGLRGAEAQELLSASAKAAAVGLGEQKEIARAATAAMQAYGDGIITAAKSTDIMMAIVREGNMEASELAPALGKVLPVASALGVSFEEVGANIAVFTRLGVSASEVVTSLRGVLNAMIKPTSEAKEELAKFGLTFEDLRNKLRTDGLASVMQELLTMTDGNIESLGRIIPSVEALANVLGTAGSQGDVYAQVLENINNSAGLVNAGFNTYAKSGAYNYATALNSVKDAGIELGNALAPMLAQLGNAVRELAGAFTGLSEEKKMAVIQVVAFTAALPILLSSLGALMGVLGGVAKALGILGGALAAGNPIVLGLLAITAALAAVIYYWDEFKNAVESITTGFASWYNSAVLIRQALAGIVVIFPAIARFATAMVSDVLQQLEKLYGAIKMFTTGNFKTGWAILGTAPMESEAIWSDMLEAMKQDWFDAQAYFRQTLTPISADQLQGGVDAMLAPLMKLKAAWDSLFSSTGGTPALAAISAQTNDISRSMIEMGDQSTQAASTFQASISKMRSALVEIQEPLAGSAAAAVAIFQDMATEVNAAMGNMVTNVAGDMVMALGYIAAGGGDIDGIFNAIMMQVATFLEYLGKAAIAAGIAMMNLKAAFANPMAALAAGAAALVLAGVLRASLSKNTPSGGLRPMASGGIAYSPTAALIGEYAGARTDPEVVAPLSKLRDMLPSGGGDTRVYGAIAGGAIRITSDRYGYDVKRINGNY